MAKNCIGLDIGSSSIKAVQVKSSKRGVSLLAFGMEPLMPQTIVDGTIMDQGAVVEAIRTLWSRLKLRQKDVAIAIAGHSVIIKKISVPPMTQQELEEQIPYEAEHHIPFAKDDVELDFEVVNQTNASGQMELLLVAAKKEVVHDYAAVVREASLNPVVVDVAAFSAQNAYEVNYSLNPEETVVIINVGAAIANINIVRGAMSMFTRDVTIGGNAFTEEIQKRLNVSQEEAEAWKIGSVGEGAHEVLPQEVEGVLAEVADGVAGQFQRSLDFFLASATDASISRIFLCGGSAKVPSLIRALQEKARTTVEVMDPFRRVIVDERRFDTEFLRQHAPEAAVAMGLALRKAGDKPS